MDDPHAAAVERWTQVLSGRTGVIDFSFGLSPRGAPAERPEVARVADVAPVDVTVTWETVTDANAFFGDNRRFEYVCGFVADAPSTRLGDQKREHLVPRS